MNEESASRTPIECQMIDEFLDHQKKSTSATLQIDSSHIQIDIITETSHSFGRHFFTCSSIMHIERDTKLVTLAIFYRADHAHIHISWLTAVFDRIIQKLIGDKRELPAIERIDSIFRKNLAHDIAHDF